MSEEQKRKRHPKPWVATRGRFNQPQSERIVLEAATVLELHRLLEALSDEERHGLVIEKRHEPGPPVIL